MRSCFIAISVVFSVAIAGANPRSLGAPEGGLISGPYENGAFESLTFVNSVAGWDTFFNAGFRGNGRVIANVEAGHIWGGHEVFQRPDGSSPAVGRTLTGTSAVDEIDFHATMVGHVLAGTGYLADEDAFTYAGLGMAPLAELWSGAIATAHSPTDIGSFEISVDATVSVYRSFFQGNGTTKPDAINSSWGYTDPPATSSAMLAIDGLATQNPTVAFVASAGNSGNATVSAPGAAFNAITVGSLGGASFLDPSDFSSRGAVDFFNPVTGVTSVGVRAAVDLSAPGEDLFLAAYLGESGSLGASTDLEIQAILSEPPPTDLYFLNQSGTSFSAPIVAGGIALLKDAGENFIFSLEGVASATDTRVIKSVLMAGSTRTTGWNNGQTTTTGGVISTTQGLDLVTGAGALDLDKAFGIYLLSGTRDLAGSAGGTIDTSGWDFASVALAGDNDYFFSSDFEGSTELTVSLNWFAGRSFDNDANIGTDLHFSDINLQIWLVEEGSLGQLVAESVSIYNNTEFLRVLLPAGEYGLRVSFESLVYEVNSDSILFEDYALAWQAVAVPEASTTVLIFLAFTVLAGRSRRRRPSQNRPISRPHLVLIPLLVAGLGACTTVPETGRPQVALLSPKQELNLGESSFSEIKRQSKVSTSSSYNAHVRRVGERIASVANVPGARWEFVVFQDPDPNAFALPGGKVGVNSGLLPITKNDAGLAAIIGHEVAHVSARHSSERISQNLLAQLGGAALDVALQVGTNVGASTRGILMQGYGAGAQVGVLLPFSRLHESEADRIGLLYMARAGYDPSEAVGVWERLAAYNRSKGGGNSISLLSTHPVDAQRIATIKKYLPEAMAEYNASRLARR